MAEHRQQAAPMVEVSPERQQGWIRQDDGRHRWWNGECWTDYYTNYPHDPVAVKRVIDSFADNPPRWVKQDDGRLRWWAGEHYTDDWKSDPEAVVDEPTDRVAGSVADEIKKLAELREAGVLTDEEFSAAKKRLLGI